MTVALKTIGMAVILTLSDYAVVPTNSLISIDAKLAANLCQGLKIYKTTRVLPALVKAFHPPPDNNNCANLFQKKTCSGTTSCGRFLFKRFCKNSVTFYPTRFVKDNTTEEIPNASECGYNTRHAIINYPVKKNFNGSAYYLRFKPKNWEEAKMECDRFNTTLTSIYNKEELASLVGLGQNHQGNEIPYIWVGGHLNETTRRFIWIDNGRNITQNDGLNMTKHWLWADDYPMNVTVIPPCLAIHKSRLIHTWCDCEYPQICKKRLPPAKLTFFKGAHYKGRKFTAPSDWESRCREVPAAMYQETKSVKTGGACVMLFNSTRCSGYHKLKVDALTQHPEDLTKHNFGHHLMSYRKCIEDDNYE